MHLAMYGAICVYAHFLSYVALFGIVHWLWHGRARARLVWFSHMRRNLYYIDLIVECVSVCMIIVYVRLALARCAIKIRANTLQLTAVNLFQFLENITYCRRDEQHFVYSVLHNMFQS